MVLVDNSNDDMLLEEGYNVHSGLSGVGRVSSSSVGNRKGYAGYEWDETISVYHVRHRVYLPEIGRWSRRDPLGYVDGMSLYQYVALSPVRYLDQLGLRRCNDIRPTPNHIPSTNGCGSGLFNPLIPKKPFGLAGFTSCCDEHDLYYDTCQRGETRRRGDEIFCLCMSAECIFDYPTSEDAWTQRRCGALADLYCFAVRLVGGLFYGSAQKHACICCDAPTPDPRCFCDPVCGCCPCVSTWNNPDCRDRCGNYCLA